MPPPPPPPPHHTVIQTSDSRGVSAEPVWSTGEHPEDSPSPWFPYPLHWWCQRGSTASPPTSQCHTNLCSPGVSAEPVWSTEEHPEDSPSPWFPYPLCLLCQRGSTACPPPPPHHNVIQTSDSHRVSAEPVWSTEEHPEDSPSPWFPYPLCLSCQRGSTVCPHHIPHCQDSHWTLAAPIL